MPLEIIFQDPITQWNWKIGVYVALIGLAGGAYLTGYVSDLLADRSGSKTHGAVAKFGYLLGFLGAAIGGPVLLSHLATPFRAMMIPLTMTNLGSWMAIGSYLIMLFVVGTVLMFLWLAFGQERPYGAASAMPDGGREVASDGGDPGTAKASTSGGFRGVAASVGLLGPVDSLADYTRPTKKVRFGIGGIFALIAAGVLLYSAMAFGEGSTGRVPLWDKTFLIPVQILSGLGVGLAASVGLTAAVDRSFGADLRKQATAAAGLLAGTLLALVATVLFLPGVREGAQPAVDNLLGANAVGFVGGALVAGLVVPIVLFGVGIYGGRSGSLSENGIASAYVAAAVLAVIGKILLALSYLLAAEFTPLPLPA